MPLDAAALWERKLLAKKHQSALILLVYTIHKRVNLWLFTEHSVLLSVSVTHFWQTDIFQYISNSSGWLALFRSP